MGVLIVATASLATVAIGQPRDGAPQVGAPKAAPPAAAPGAGSAAWQEILSLSREAVAHQKAGRLAKAAAKYEQAVARSSAAMGKDHLETWLQTDARVVWLRQPL